MDFVDEKFHQLVGSDGSKANATIITTSVDGIGDGNFNLSSLDDGEREKDRAKTMPFEMKSQNMRDPYIYNNTLVNVCHTNGNY